MTLRLAMLALVLAGFPAFAAQPDNQTATAAAGGQYGKIDRYQPRFGRSRPLIAVVGENIGTELVDFVVPFGILSQSGVADVLAVATQPGALQMRPALRLQPDATIESFDERFPDGADYVIVPAVVSMGRGANARLIEWITAQAAKGASVVSICDGALIVAQTGLFKGHRATGHWATQAMREHDFPDTEWLENTRYVADGKVISSAGVTAAIPLSLALIEAIAGSERAAQVAADVGVSGWSTDHDSEQFHLGFGTYATAIRNWLLPRQEIGVPLAAGVDEIALALTADAYSRTYRSRAYTVAASAEVIRTLHGLKVLPDRVLGEDDVPKRVLPAVAAMPSALALDQALGQIESSYGRSTAKFVAQQLEYPRL